MYIEDLLNTIIDDTLSRLVEYFSQENYNGMLKFDTKHISSLGRLAYLSSGDGRILFHVAFKEMDMLEKFMMYIGLECEEIGTCLILADNLRDVELIQRYWIFDDDDESSEDDELPSLD